MVDRTTLSNMWFIQDDILARTGGGRVFWDRFWGTKRDNMENQCSANFMINKDTMSDKAVLGTVSGVQYQACQRSFSLQLR